MEDVIPSYNQAEYFIDDFDEPIKIGNIHSAIDRLVKESGVSTWCFITAWNPLSVEFSEAENAVRNEKLKAELEKYQILEGEGRDSNGEWRPERSFLVLGISKKDAKTLAAKFGQRAIIHGESGKPAELIETLFTQGNCEIIRQNKTAFLCSRKVSASIVLKCYDWAIEQREAGNCVIGGFHSQIEKDVLHYLLKGNQPIIVALARGLKKRLEPEFEKPLAEGRLLIITPFDEKVKRVGKDTAFIRNKLMIDLAESITVGYAEKGGMLEKIIGNSDKKTDFI